MYAASSIRIRSEYDEIAQNVNSTSFRCDGRFTAKPRRALNAYSQQLIKYGINLIFRDFRDFRDSTAAQQHSSTAAQQHTQT
jgi:hypothetical protein